MPLGARGVPVPDAAGLGGRDALHGRLRLAHHGHRDNHMSR